MTPPETIPLLVDALRHGIRPGLERTTALLAAMQHPQERLKVIHVAGTNGKGSVCAFLGAALSEAGYRVGRYSSPHLISYCERFWAQGRFITASELEWRLQRVSKLAQALDEQLGPVTEFELLTAVAFEWFAEQQLDVLLLEVGLGGRLDATNVVEKPLVTVITRIARDHVALLGESTEAIAREKAGILKPGVPLVTGTAGSALAEIQDAAQALAVPIQPAPPVEWREGNRCRLGAETFQLGLSGPYQAQNAAIAYQVLQCLREQGWSIPDTAVRKGLAQARWPGRLEHWSSATGQRYLFDGAHNVDGVTALVEALAADVDPQGRLVLAGFLVDKEPMEMIHTLLPHSATLILTMPPSPRALDPLQLGPAIVHPDAFLVPEWAEALELAQSLAKGREIVVAGSLYLVGAVAQALGRTIDP